MTHLFLGVLFHILDIYKFTLPFGIGYEDIGQWHTARTDDVPRRFFFGLK